METTEILKKESKKLQRELFAKLAKVQNLCINRVLNGEVIVFKMCSFSESASLSNIGGLDATHEKYSVRINVWPHIKIEDYNSIIQFYKEQIYIINYWIQLLTESSNL